MEDIVNKIEEVQCECQLPIFHPLQEVAFEDESGLSRSIPRWQRALTGGKSGFGYKEDMVRLIILPDQMTLRMEASGVNLDATATTKQEHVDDYSRGGDEDGVVEQTELNRREVNSSVHRTINSIGLRAPTTIKYENPLQKLDKAGREWTKPLQDDLDEENAGFPKASPSQ